MEQQSKNKIKNFIAAGKLEKALEHYTDYLKDNEYQALYNDMLSLQSQYNASKRKYRLGTLTEDEWNKVYAKTSAALLEQIDQIEENAGKTPESNTLTVFISYNHNDYSTVEPIKDALEAEKFNVIIDSQSMEPGEDISSFINRAVQKSDVTVSIISNNSLLSGWVGMETINTFFLENTRSSKKFIACYTDNDFFDPEFRLRATENIDQRIEKLDELMKKYEEKKIDSNDLNKEKTRLYDLRHNLGMILDKLRNSLCLDVSSNEQLNKNIPQLISTLRKYT